MSDEKIRGIARRFAAGDMEAGARLAGEMLRARTLLSALADLSPALQSTLAGLTVAEGIQEQIQEALAEGIDIAEIAAEIDVSDVAGEIDTGEVAENLSCSIDASDVAYHIEVSDVASHISTSDVAGEIFNQIHNELDIIHEVAASIQASDLAAEIDLTELASEVADQLRSTVEEIVQEALDARE